MLEIFANTVALVHATVVLMGSLAASPARSLLVIRAVAAVKLTTSPKPRQITKQPAPLVLQATETAKACDKFYLDFFPLPFFIELKNSSFVLCVLILSIRNWIA